LQEFDATPVLKLIEMLLSISHDDRQKCLESSSQQASSCQLEHLICSLQSRLLAWCQQCLSDNADDDRRHRDQNAADDESHLIVQAVIVRCTCVNDCGDVMLKISAFWFN